LRAQDIVIVESGPRLGDVRLRGLACGLFNWAK
jgi:hypothetical protein